MVPIALFNFQDSNFTNITTSASINGQSQTISEAKTIATQLTWSAGSTPVGYLSLDCSNDNVNWISVGQASISGSSGTTGVNFDLPGYFYARLRMNMTSGSLTVNSAYLSAKR